MRPALWFVGALIACAGGYASPSNAAQGGNSTEAFTRAFAGRVHVGMTFSDLLRVAGEAGRETHRHDGTMSFHWDGSEQTTLDADVRDGIVRHLVMIEPKGAIVIESLPGN